ncbi:MAG: hypothetical protein IPP46_10950 [Bacteroidetes bacterium]|nr:hypothetical protein [Bacteroidota bacterium]
MLLTYIPIAIGIEVAESFVLRINISGNKSAHRKSAICYSTFKKDDFA